MGKAHGLSFDTYTSSADHASLAWASTDRGWLYRQGVGCVGFYLAYPAIAGYREAFVLASVYDRVVDPITGRERTQRHRSKDCASVDEAQQWLLAESMPQEGPRWT